jgi:hypothetical protein
MSTISQRAVANVRPMPVADQPLSEQYRIVSKNYVDAKAAAELLEESKSAVLSRMMAAKGEIPVSKAEMLTKASNEWRDYIETMVEARRKADLLKCQLEFIRMRHAEWQSMEANARAERKLS